MSENGTYLFGLIAAKVAIAEVVGEIPMIEMSDQAWEMQSKVTARINELIERQPKEQQRGPRHDLSPGTADTLVSRSWPPQPLSPFGQYNRATPRDIAGPVLESQVAF